jgi:uncharacterized membrane protein YfcA
MELTEIFGYFGALIVGLVLGLVGGGGSILTLPIMVYLLSYSPIMAAAYSLFVVGVTSLVGAAQKYREKLVDIKTGIAFSFPSFLAVYFSRRYLVHTIPESLFTIGDFNVTKDMAMMLFFAIIMILASFSMIKNTKDDAVIYTHQPYYKTFIHGLIIGSITGIIGAGGGFLYVPALVLWANLPMKKAVGTSLIIIAINSLLGFMGDLHNINVDWKFLLSFSTLTILGIIIGHSLSKFISNTILKKAFGYFTLFMAILIIYKEL